MSLPNLKKKAAPGFTLVEMAIVLVIIGIILAGVMKGRDIVRGAQVKQFSQQFAQKWGTVCQTYYDKTGQQLNDGTANGGTTGPEGLMDGAAGTNSAGIISALEGVGISVCTIVKSKLLVTAGASPAGDPGSTNCGASVNTFQTLVEGEYAGSQPVSIDLLSRPLTYGTGTSAKTYTRNIVVLYNVPIDVARGLDTAVDGKDDGAAGNCVGLSAAAGYTPAVAAAAVAAAPTATAWGTADTGNSQNVGIVLDY